MNILAYNPSEHSFNMAQLLCLRDLPTNLVSDLPKNGFIALDEDGTPIAAGFLRGMEGPYGMLDSYISNPKHSRKDRHNALDEITKRLIALAEELGLNKLIAFSKDDGIISRALSNGFVNLKGHQLQILSIK